MKKHPRIFGLYTAIHPEEFFAMVQPMTTLLLKPKKKIIFSYKFDESKINKIYIPKISNGKWGNEGIITVLDYLWYALISTLMFPYLLTYDIILFHGPPFFQCHLVPLLRLFGKRVYTIVIDAQLPVHNVNMIKKIYYKIADILEYINVKFSTETFATSKWLYNRYRKYTKNVIYTPNGADVEVISKIKPKRIFKEFTISYLGGFEMWRGLDMIIDAVKEINKNNKEKIRLVLMGGGPDFEKIKSIADNDSNITFTGYLNHDEAMQYCKGSDLLVMPSRNCLASQTISSIKCFEYVACEVPTIVTDSGEHAYWIKKFGAGIVVKDNVKSIKKGIEKLTKNKAIYKKIKENCKENKNEIDYKRFKKPFVNIVLNTK
jgi:glycosyltransferase involved in cell wall biosynthesis